MTPKEKAKQLYELIRYDISMLKGSELLINKISKCNALFLINEILKELEDIDDGQTFIPYEYWTEVKQEIEKL